MKLKRFAEIRVSNVDKKAIEGQQTVRLCNYTDVYYHDILTSDLDFMQATATPDQIRDFSLRPGDILVTKDSETPDDIGVPAFVPEPLHGVISGYHLAIIRTDPKVLDPKYAFWTLVSNRARQEYAVGAQGVTRFGLRHRDIGNVTVTMRSLSEQRAIADFLDRETIRIDTLISKKRQLMNSLEEHRRSIIFHGACGLLGEDVATHDPGLPWAREVRAHWPAVKITFVAKLGTGHTPSRSRPELWENATIPWITTGEIQQVRDDRREVITETWEKISELGLANSAAVLHPKGTVVLCRTASAGFSAIMGSDMATSQDFVTWTCSERLLPRYLLMCLRAMRQDLLGRLAFGSTHKTIYWPDIEGLRIPLPPPAEQALLLRAIGARLAPLDKVRSELETQLDLLQEHRQTLVTAAVAGQGQPLRS